MEMKEIEIATSALSRLVIKRTRTIRQGIKATIGIKNVGRQQSNANDAQNAKGHRKTFAKRCRRSDVAIANRGDGDNRKPE